MSWVDFLKSKVVAENVASRAWEYLRTHGYGDRERKHLVQVKQSPSYPGTWQVMVFLPGITYSGRFEGGEAINRREREAAVAALRAAYSNSDLVTSYTRPARR